MRLCCLHDGFNGTVGVSRPGFPRRLVPRRPCRSRRVLDDVGAGKRAPEFVRQALLSPVFPHAGPPATLWRRPWVHCASPPGAFGRARFPFTPSAGHLGRHRAPPEGGRRRRPSSSCATAPQSAGKRPTLPGSAGSRSSHRPAGKLRAAQAPPGAAAGGPGAVRPANPEPRPWTGPAGNPDAAGLACFDVLVYPLARHRAVTCAAG